MYFASSAFYASSALLHLFFTSNYIWLVVAQGTLATPLAAKQILRA